METEHLLSALSAFAITDVLVGLDGPEVPLFDGSAAVFGEMLEEAGAAELASEVEPIRLAEPILVADAERAILALPAEEPTFGYVLDYTHPLIGRQFALYKQGSDDYLTELAPARTFVTEEQARALLESERPSGKRLDFLAQELMREANTVGSKAASAAVVQEVVQLKTEIERVREQVQNVE